MSSGTDLHDDDDVLPGGRADPAAAAAALEALLRAHRAGLHAFLRRRVPADLQSLIDPQDVLQDVYLEAFRRLTEFPAAAGGGLAFAWLLAVARNRLINLIHHHGAAKRGGPHQVLHPSQAAGDGGGGDDVALVLEELAVFERTPSRSALAHEAVAALERSLDRLSDDHRRAIRMRYVEQMPYAEIALALGRTRRAAEQMCFRAVACLRTEMAAEWR